MAIFILNFFSSFLLLLFEYMINWHTTSRVLVNFKMRFLFFPFKIKKRKWFKTLLLRKKYNRKITKWKIMTNIIERKKELCCKFNHYLTTNSSFLLVFNFSSIWNYSQLIFIVYLVANNNNWEGFFSLLLLP